MEKSFVLFGESLKNKELIINKGEMLDGCFATIFNQRNTPEENKKIKDGEGDAKSKFIGTWVVIKKNQM